MYLAQVGDPADRLSNVLARAEDYAQAGADGLFVPGLLDLGTINELVASTPMPVNVMAGPGGPTIAQLRDVGVRRISVGTGLAQAAYTVAQRAAGEIFQAGTFQALTGAMTYPEINALFPSASPDPD